MFFNKPLYTPNFILVDSPVSGSDKLNISSEILEHIKIGNKLVVICAEDSTFINDYGGAIIEQEDYVIYRERNREGQTISSELLKKDPAIVYCISAKESGYRAALSNVCDLIGTNYPILCISLEISKSIMPSCIVVPEEKDKQNLLQENNIPAESNIFTLSEFKKQDVNFSDGRFNLQHLQPRQH